MRPVSPGTYPRQGATEIVNFDDRQMVEQIQRKAWGYIEYNRQLTDEEVAEYELVSEEEKTWYGVVLTVYDNGTLRAYPVATKKSAIKPEDAEKELKTKTVYIDWFASREEAEQFAEKAEDNKKEVM